MSALTSVSGFIRIDGIPFGREYLHKVHVGLTEVMENASRENGDGFRYKIIGGPCSDNINIFNIWLYGDIRGFVKEDTLKISEFFKKMSESAEANNFIIRSAIVEYKINDCGIYVCHLVGHPELNAYEFLTHFIPKQ